MTRGLTGHAHQWVPDKALAVDYFHAIKIHLFPVDVAASPGLVPTSLPVRWRKGQFHCSVK
jgi:hypothetical protein